MNGNVEALILLGEKLLGQETDVDTPSEII
jgi:hypothetical protein